MKNECHGVVIDNMITYRLTDHEEDAAVLLIPCDDLSVLVATIQYKMSPTISNPAFTGQF